MRFCELFPRGLGGGRWREVGGGGGGVGGGGVGEVGWGEVGVGGRWGHFAGCLVIVQGVNISVKTSVLACSSPRPLYPRAHTQVEK